MSIHLVVFQGVQGANEPGYKLVVEGRFGCDYAWNDDFTAYRCLPHRWIPGSDSSYLAYQAGDYSDDYSDYEEPRDEESVPSRSVSSPAPVVVDPDDDLPF